MSDLSLVNGLRADLHEPECPGMDEDGNWLGPCGCAKRTYDETLHKIGEIVDDCHDRTSVFLDGAEVHVTVVDQTMSDGLDEDHEPDGGWPDSARGVYTLAQATELRDLLSLAIDTLKVGNDGRCAMWITDLNDRCNGPMNDTGRTDPRHGGRVFACSKCGSTIILIKEGT